jgi:hypothetical protein
MYLWDETVSLLNRFFNGIASDTMESRLDPVTEWSLYDTWTENDSQ